MHKGDPSIPPKRPPKPKNLRHQISEPLYITTLPESFEPDSPPKLKGILKHNDRGTSTCGDKNRSSSVPSIETPFIDEQLIKKKDERHFNLTIEEKENVLTNDGNTSTHLLPSPKIGKKSGETKQKKPITNTDPKPKSDFQMTSSMIEKATFAAKVESVSGILHLIVIITSIITLSAMAKLTNVWEIHLRRCPLYVKTSKNTGVYWGNESMAACHYAAYMPALILVMSISLIIFHGGILYSWRNGKEISKLLLSRNYAKVMFFMELFEMVIAISVACVIIDGVRQTCLSFQLNPWPDERPDNCKDGYFERDEVYGITKTYSKLITSMVSSMISCFMLITTSILYLIRINPCCRGRG